MNEADILYQAGPFWVKRVEHTYEVYRDGATHATRCATIAHEGIEGLEKAKAEADKRAARVYYICKECEASFRGDSLKDGNLPSHMMNHELKIRCPGSNTAKWE